MDNLALATQLGKLLLKHQGVLTAAESCTGGLLSATVTECPGSSAWFDRGFVTYSNQAKQEMLGVAEAIIKQHGAVSEATVIAMAKGALVHSKATHSVAISGIAGPSGGSAEKPVGLVWIAWADHEGYVKSQVQILQGTRQSIREQSVSLALEGLMLIA